MSIRYGDNEVTMRRLVEEQIPEEYKEFVRAGIVQHKQQKEAFRKL